MSESRDDKIVTELRETAPAAPDSLRERVRTLREPQPGRAWRLRPALVAAVAIVVAVGVSAATITSAPAFACSWRLIALLQNPKPRIIVRIPSSV